MQADNILIITSFPPRKCGIATYSQDLIKAIEDKYTDSFTVNVCALRKKDVLLEYPHEVNYFLKTWLIEDYKRLALEINLDEKIKIVYLQHEFGLFDGDLGEYIIDFLDWIEKPVITTFHTVLKQPDSKRKIVVQKIVEFSSKVIVMTQLSEKILREEYQIPEEKVTVIPHGTPVLNPYDSMKKKTFLSMGNSLYQLLA